MTPATTQFQNKFIGFTSLKVLETVVYSEDNAPTRMELELDCMDKSMADQLWKLKPFSAYNQNVQSISIWDAQHDTVYRKNYEDANENSDLTIPEDLFK